MQARDAVTAMQEPAKVVTDNRASGMKSHPTAAGIRTENSVPVALTVPWVPATAARANPTAALKHE